MTDLFCPAASPTLPDPTDWHAPDIPAIIATLQELAIARIGDRDDAEDLVQETLIAAWQQGASLAPADLGRLLTERCHGWQACRRAARATLGRLTAAGDPLPPWLTGSSDDADGETIVALALLRITIAERLCRPTRDRDAATRRDATGDARPTGPTSPTVTLPAIPADLAVERPIAAALVRAGAPTGPATPPLAPRPRRRRPAIDDETGRSAAAPTRHARLQAQVRERERAVERAVRHLDAVRRRYDHAVAAEERAAADTALTAAAGRHERALAARRELASRSVASAARRERRR